MNSLPFWCRLPKPRGAFVLLIFSAVAVLCSPLAIQLHSKVEDEYIYRVLLKEGQSSRFGFGRENFDACEKYWRSELRWHWIDVKHDRLYGIAKVRLAGVIQRKARYFGKPIPAEAEELLKDGVQVEEALGGELYCVQNATEELANNYQLRKLYDESEKLLKQKLASLKFGYSHRVQEIISQLADQYIEQKRYADAVNLLTSTFQKLKTMGLREPGYPWYFFQLIQAYHAMGEYNQIVSICKTPAYSSAIPVTPIRSYLADSLHKLRRNDEAIALYKEDLNYERQRRWYSGDTRVWVPLPDTQSRAASDLFALGEIYFEQKEYAKAEPMLKEAIDIGKRKLLEKQPEWIRKSETQWLKEASTTLAKVYCSQGRINTAADVMATSP